MAARIDALEAGSKALNEKVEAAIGFNDEMKSNLAAAQVTASDVSQLKSDNKIFKTSIDALQKNLAGAMASIDTVNKSLASGTATPNIDNTRIDNLEKDLASLKQSGGTSTDTVLLSQSLSDLKAKIAAGVSYQSELDRIKALVPAAEGLDVLQSQAATGIATIETLTSDLQNIKFPSPEATIQDDSWWAYAGNVISSVVTIKAAGTSDWQGMAANVAEIAKQGDLALAIATLEKAEGGLPPELQTWHDRAASRIGIEQALEKTAAAVLRQIAAKG
jgi:hypothetical protein